MRSENNKTILFGAPVFILQTNPDSTIGDYLNTDTKRGIQHIIDVDKANMRLLEKYYTRTSLSSSVEEDSFDPGLLFHLAEVAPIFSESKSCLTEAFAFLEGLMSNETWAFQSEY